MLNIIHVELPWGVALNIHPTECIPLPSDCMNVKIVFVSFTVVPFPAKPEPLEYSLKYGIILGERSMLLLALVFSHQLEGTFLWYCFHGLL